MCVCVCVCVCVLNLRLVGFFAFCLPSRILVYFKVNIVLFKSAASIDLVCLRHSPCAVYFMFPMFV